ncbi:hypothetical protein N8I77_000243 [Diaporthe amygdali]|uniref:WSC domain-containing protein n=1 Tax=Phomopsis amygdali TaxID=1214568 RepID=A0AAD9W6X5_PHOAM|nr:hypothetical protein N8I77_000243 [Diaporthe amygdali]
MRCPTPIVVSALWVAAVAAHISHDSTYTAASHDWTIVESHCWSDTKHNVRALNHHAVNWDTSCATTEKCLAACEIEGYCLAGLEYGHECWCGNSVHGDVRPVPDSYCNFPCSGDYDDTCGGYGYMGLHIRKGFKFIVEPPRYAHHHDQGLPGGRNGSTASSESTP